MRRLLLVCAVLVALASYGAGLLETAHMSETERDARGETVRLSQLEAIDHHQLVSATLVEGQRAMFEVCSGDAFAFPEWQRASFRVLALPPGAEPEVAATVAFAELDPDMIERGEQGGCVVFKRWDEVLVSSEFSIGLQFAPPGLDVVGTSEPSVRGRILAYRPIGGLGRGSVLGALLAALLIILAFVFSGREPSEFEVEAKAEERTPKWPAPVRVGAAIGILLAFMFLIGFVRGGSAMATIRALMIAAAQVALAVWLVSKRARAPSEHPRLDHGLMLSPPRPGMWILALMPFLGLLVWIVGARLGRLIPSTGLAPIEAFVSFPSGSLALALIAVFVPIAEELFFRGFVYTTLDRWKGANVATAASVLAFAVVHLPQQWGAWGAFVSVSVTGVVLTLLRRFTRSTLPSMVAHLAHNAAITLLTLFF